MKRLNAGEYPLGKAFSSDFEFAIPDNQRPYSCGTEQALQLLDDLDGAIDRDPDEQELIHSRRQIFTTTVRSDLNTKLNTVTKAF